LRSGEVKVKQPIFLAILTIILAGIVLCGVGGAAVCFADTIIPHSEVSSTEGKIDDPSSAWNWGIYVAFAALIVSIASTLWNYHHSESLFRRREYPAVLWYRPNTSKAGPNTTITTSIYNKGPRDISCVFLGLFLCRGFRKEAWCRSNSLEIKIGEPLDFVITQELELDIKERFGGLSYKDGWQFDGHTRRYKAITILEYLPILAGTEPFHRKEYFLLIPVTESGKIKSWAVRRIPNWQGRLPWY
jgi:hypothetical protein